MTILFLFVALFVLSELRSVPELLRPVAALNDKVLHALLYSALGLALAWGRARSSPPPPHYLLLLAGYLYGALDEWHQSFVPGRTPEFGDWVADVVGVTLGYAAGLLLFRWRRDRAHPPSAPTSSPSPSSARFE